MTQSQQTEHQPKRHPRGKFGYMPQKNRPRIRGPVMAGMVVLVIMIVGFGGWAVVTPLEAASIANGKLTVKNHVKTVQHLEGGIIKTIHVKEGQWVKQGDPLITLDDTQPRARLTLVHVQANERIAEQARLIAERDKKTNIQFPNYLFQRANYDDIKYIIQGQVNIFQANNTNLATTVDILEKRMKQSEDEIISLQSQISSAINQIKYVDEELDAVRYLDKKGLIEKPRLLALERERARLIGEKEERTALIARAKQQIGETRIQIVNTYARQRTETLNTLRDTQRELADLLERERAAIDVLNRTVIRAPISGTVNDLKVHTDTGVIGPREVLMNIVPNQDELIVEARVNPLDIDVVHQGLPAKVTLSAFKQRHVNQLEGIVTYVSADIFNDERTAESFYIAYVRINDDQLNLTKGLKLYQGMPAQVMIITDKRTPLEYFTIPLKDSLNRAFRED